MLLRLLIGVLAPALSLGHLEDLRKGRDLRVRPVDVSVAAVGFWPGVCVGGLAALPREVAAAIIPFEPGREVSWTARIAARVEVAVGVDGGQKGD